MEKDQQSGGAAPIDAGSAGQGLDQGSPRGPEQQSTEWKDRILREKKDLAAKYSNTEKALREANQKIEALTGQQLQKDGKLEEYNKHLESQLQAEREKRLDDRAKFAHRTLSERLRAEAMNLGCVDPDTVMKIADIDRVTITEDLNVDDTSVKLLMEDLRKSKPYLFKGKAIPVKDGSPAAGLDAAREATPRPQVKSHMEQTNAEFSQAFRDNMSKALRS